MGNGRGIIFNSTLHVVDTRYVVYTLYIAPSNLFRVDLDSIVHRWTGSEGNGLGPTATGECNCIQPVAIGFGCSCTAILEL
jgi:hypothetical protein